MRHNVEFRGRCGAIQGAMARIDRTRRPFVIVTYCHSLTFLMAIAYAAESGVYVHLIL
jgi:hypothetical protein